MKRLAVIGAFLIVAAGIVGTLQAQGGSADRNSLRGLSALCVHVEPIPAILAGADLTDAEVEAEVEFRLKKSGIRILFEQEALKLPGKPFLHIHIGAAKAADLPVYAISITGSVVQQVTLERNTSLSGPAQSWSITAIGIARDQELAQRIKATLDSMVDRFTQDYRSVNPPPRQ